jgi:hypothetical protein
LALLSLGALGDADHPNKATSERIVRELTSQLAASNEPSQTIVALQAIGNSGNAAAIDAVYPYLHASDDAVRVNALESLRRMNDPRASTLLMQSFEEDTSTAMRSAALRSLANMPANDQTMSWGRSALATGLSTPNLAQMAGWLGSQAEHFPENEKALRLLLAENPPFEVKKSILKYVAP